MQKFQVIQEATWVPARKPNQYCLQYLQQKVHKKIAAKKAHIKVSSCSCVSRGLQGSGAKGIRTTRTCERMPWVQGGVQETKQTCTAHAGPLWFETVPVRRVWEDFCQEDQPATAQENPHGGEASRVCSLREVFLRCFRLSETLQNSHGGTALHLQPMWRGFHPGEHSLQP